MKIAVVGSRDYPDLERVRDVVRTFSKDAWVVSGGARGPDSVAVDEAQRCGLGWTVYYPDWRPDGIYNPRAGFERNTHIINDADEVYAFWDGASRGTLDSMQKAMTAGKPVIVYEPGKMPYRYEG